MLKRMLVLTMAVIGLALCAGPMDYWTPPKKKLIECGWSQTMGVERLCAAVKILEKHTPYQGVSIALSGRDEKGKKFATNFMFGPEHDSGRGPKVERWKYEYFKEDIEFLKKTKFTKFTDNFFWTNSRSGNVEWSDDHDWDIVCNNFGIIARVAKETGVKGIIFDGEFYGNKSKPIFSFLEKGRTADDMVALARKRGQQWGRAIFSNYPDIKLFLIFSFAWKEAQRATPEMSSLMIPFLNGMYDVLPPTATVIEGHEHHAYGAATQADFAHLRTDMGEVFMQMVDKKNIKKYKLQTQLAPALYLDPYLRPNCGDSTFMKHLRPMFEKAPKLTVFRRNITRALSMADEYVWTWGEGGKWYPHKAMHPHCRLFWEEVNPGVTRTVESATDPLTYAKAVVKEKKLKNIAKDPTMSDVFIRDRRPKYYDFWPKNDGYVCEKAVKGGSTGKDAIRISGCGFFTLSQDIKVKQDQLYLIRARMKKVSGKSAKYNVLVSYDDHLKRAGWNRTTQTVRFGKPDEKGWQIAEIAVIVPENMVNMHIRICGGKQHPEDAAIFDLLEVFKVDDGHYVK